jgi:hypothetical protein
MEPVLVPKVISSVSPADRVKRARPRGDSGGGSGFARYLRQKKEPPAGAPSPPPENPPEDAGSAPLEDPAEHGGPPTKKLIDIRV